MIIHPLYHRTLTVREAARLQSFPDSYIFVDSNKKIRKSPNIFYQMIADAVPPYLARAVAKSVYAALEELNLI